MRPVQVAEEHSPPSADAEPLGLSLENAGPGDEEPSRLTTELSLQQEIEARLVGKATTCPFAVQAREISPSAMEM